MEPASLRVLLVSDLHVDFPQNRARLEDLAPALLAQEADVLVVAGDVSHKLDQLGEALGRFRGFRGPKLFVAGNHDVWIVRPKPDGPADSWAKLKLVHETARREGFHPLEEANVDVGPFTFAGSIGWYDYSYAAPKLELGPNDYAGKTWGTLNYMDGAYARWGVPDAVVVDRLLASLNHRLDAARSPVIFVSHHVPLEDLVLRRGDPSWDYFNAFMGSRRIEASLARHGVQRFLFGHTHRPVNLVEPGRCVINNPLGYPRQALNPILRPFVVT